MIGQPPLGSGDNNVSGIGDLQFSAFLSHDGGGPGLSADRGRGLDTALACPVL